MKKMKNLLFGAAAISMLMFSCKKDNNAPLITGFEGDGTYNPGDSVMISATFTDAEGLASYKMDITTSNGASVKSDAGTLEGTSYSYKYNWVIPTGAADGETYTVQITVTDDNKDEALTVTETKTITVDIPVTAGNITTYSAKLLGGQSNPSTGSFFNSTNGSVLTSAQADAASASVDFIFAYGTTNLNYIAAPNDADIALSHSNVGAWSTKNATKFKTTTLTASQFTALTDDATIVSEASGASATKVNALAVGQVFSFTTAAGKKGLVHVSAIGGTMASDRSITIDVKVQQ